jgi:hypothetical protein
MFLMEHDARSMEIAGDIEPLVSLLSNNGQSKDSEYLKRAAFQINGGIRVAWVQDFVKPNGGAEITNYYTVHIGENIGFDIVGFCNSNRDRSIIDTADIVIINNLRSNEEMRKQVSDLVIDTGKPFIRFDHDYFEDDPQLYRKSKLNIFLSPDHKAHYVAMCGKEIEEKSKCLPLAIDSNRYKAIDTIERKKNSVFIPNYGKCDVQAQRFKAENRQCKYTFGNNFNAQNYTYHDMPRLYNEHEIVFHKPAKKWAGERVLFEAVLCGCKVIADENSGHTSWDFDWQNRSVLKEKVDAAPFEFWKLVESVL